MRYEEVWSFETRNFKVTFGVAPDERAPEACFEFQKDIDAVRNGELAWFIAKLAIYHKPSGALLSWDTLGGCAYENILRDFVEAHWRNPYEYRNTLESKAKRQVFCDYFTDMVRIAIKNARKEAETIKAIPLRAA